MTSPWEQFRKKNGGVAPWDLFNPEKEKLEDKESLDRFSICEGCPKLIKLTSQCKECGCFMKAKVKLKEASCPLGKW